MSALNVTIDPSIKGAWPEARLGCFIYTADVRAREDSLWTCLENEVAPYLKTMLETTPLAQIPNLAESRKAYKAFGKDPGRFRVSSEAGEVYPGIGKDDIALENMPLLADGEGAFGSPTSDSTRAMITQETRSCLTVVFSFSARSKLEEALALTVKRFGQYANPSHAESFIIE